MASYDNSKLYSSSKGAEQKNMVDPFNFSPAADQRYNYKECIVKELHLMGTENQSSPALGNPYGGKMTKAGPKQDLA